jgi:LDH2 family malate/lactate/ureidoglycolate dehydrogenase
VHRLLNVCIAQLQTAMAQDRHLTLMLLARPAALGIEAVEACVEEQEGGVVVVVAEVAEVMAMVLSKQTGLATVAIWSVSHCTFLCYVLQHSAALQIF